MVNLITRDEMDSLAERIRADDSEAVALFAERVGRALRLWLLSRGAPPADADEASVNAVGDAVLHIDAFEFRGSGSFYAWVKRIAWNNFLRLRGGREQPLGEYESSRRDAPVALNDDLVTAIRTALGGLPAPEQDLLIARAENSGLTFADLGKSLGMSENAARVRHHRAKRKLAKALREHPAVVAWRKKVARREEIE